MHPSPPFVNAAQPLPVPVAPPPTIPDDLHPAGAQDELPFDPVADRRARRRALYARLLGVLGILVTAAFAAVTVGRAWLRSLPSVVWPSMLERPETPDLPGPLGPRHEPVLPAPSVEPPLAPPTETAPATPMESAESARPEPIVPGRAEPLPAPTTRPEASAPVETKPTPARPRAAPARKAPPLPADSALPPEHRHDRMTPEDLPAAPAVDPASPDAPPAGEAPPADQPPRIPADEGNTIFGDD